MKTLQEIIGERVAFGAWSVYEDELIDPARCRRVAEVGLDFGYASLSQRNRETILSNCEQSGLRVMAFVDEIMRLPADHSYRMPSLLEPYVSSPAYAGTALRDEPGVADFPRLRRHLDAHRKAAPEKIGLVNLFPIYANSDQLGGVDYETYISRFASEVDDRILSYDSYPLYGQGGQAWLQDDYLRNFEIVARQAQKTGSQLWFFIQTLSFNYTHRDPGERDLRWQIFCAMSFGTRVIQLFTYGTPPNGDEYFEDALIDRAGNRTPRYDMAKNIIAEFNRWTGRYVPYRWVGAMTRGRETEHRQREYDVIFPGGICRKHALMGTYMDMEHELTAFSPVVDFSGDAPLLMGCFEKNGGEAFTLVNMTDPAQGRSAHANLRFAGPARLMVSGKGGTSQVEVPAEWNVTLESGEGVFAEILR